MSKQAIWSYNGLQKDKKYVIHNECNDIITATTECKAIPYLKIDAVDSFVSTEHDLLVSKGPENRTDSPIDKGPALLQCCTRSMDGCRKFLWIDPFEVKGIKKVLKLPMNITENL